MWRGSGKGGEGICLGLLGLNSIKPAHQSLLFAEYGSAIGWEDSSRDEGRGPGDFLAGWPEI